MSFSLSRRRLIRNGLVAAAGSSLIGKASASALPSADKKDVEYPGDWTDFKVGIASYTFRKLSLDDTIKALQRLNLKFISIKDFHLSLNSTKAERSAAMQKLKDAGITPLSCGNITLQNNETDVRRAFEYAKDCAMPAIVCSPDPNSMALLDKMVREYDIKLAIHNHGPEDKRFPSPYDVYKAVQGYDQRIGLCIDVGHTARARVNPAEAILKCKDRLYDLHFKDINTTEPNGTTIEAGRGVLHLPAIVKALQKIKYPHLVSIEFEGWEADPLPAVAETVGYTNALLAAIGKKKIS
ncbi:MAG TPA: sugar phosphate isomerase/epimerase [Flavisolibacter sp.]|nr:sugar phosphate isomerase/epimerase [Flavisolibacter sp.]